MFVESCVAKCSQPVLGRKDTTETVGYDSYGSISEDEEDPPVTGRVTLVECVGCPTTEELMQEVDKASLPGVFCCGPTGLVKSIHRLAEQKCMARLEECTKHASAYVAVYDEVFLM